MAVTDVMSTLDLMGNVAGVTLAGLETTVINVLWAGWDLTVAAVPLTLDLPDNVTLVMTDGSLQPVIKNATDLAAVTRVNVKVVSRMADGKDR